MSKQKKIYFLSFMISQILLFLLGIGVAIYVFIVSYKADTLLQDALPLIYLAFHFAMLFFGIVMSFKAFKRDSLIFNTLCFDEEGNNINGPKVFSAVLFTFGLVAFVYFLIVLCGVKLPGYQLSIGLIADLSYVGLTLMVVFGYYFIYPFLFGWNANSANKI